MCFNEKSPVYCLNTACLHDEPLPFIVGTKVSSVSKASIVQTKLAIPKYEEHQAVSAILSDLDGEITALKKLTKCRQVKQSIMQQFLTSKIRLI